MDSRIASDQGLELVDVARKKLRWNKHDCRWYTEAHVSLATLRRFWERSKKISSASFISICQAVNLEPSEVWELEIDPISNNEMEIMVFNNDEWVEREFATIDLLAKLRKSHRIVVLLGIAGIGKTALAESLVVKLRGAGWNELRENWDNTTRPKEFVAVTSSWLISWGEKVTHDLHHDPQQILNLVIEKLCNGRYLLLLDSLEYLLVADSDSGWGDFADTWWGKFWRGLLSAPVCHSRIIITSQDFPVQLAQDCDRYPNLWHQQIITGLTVLEQQELFAKMDLIEDLDVPNHQLMLMGEIYAGHPLALRVIGGEIKQSYQGNISAYWQENRIYIQQVQEDLRLAKEAGAIQGVTDRWKLDSYTKQLRRRVQERIKLTFQRLQSQAPIAHELICGASIYRCEVPDDFWLDQLAMEGYDQEQQLMAITTLRDRFLVEDCGFDAANIRLVAQHNLIRSVAISQRLEFYSGSESDE